MRKLASVRRIADVRPIEGADRIVCAVVDGWELVTQKSNNFQTGDLVVYFECDSFLPVCEKFEFLRGAGCFKSTKNLGDGFRLKTIKLRGQVSQGLILPLSELFEEKDGAYLVPPDFDMTNAFIENPDEDFGDDQVEHIFTEGDDLTDYLNVQKYEKPIPAHLAGRTRGNFPTFVAKTDQERLQNVYGKYSRKYADMEFEMTLKMDGSSMTVYHYKEDDKDPVISVCSRNLDLIETDDNTFWQVARKTKLVETLTKLGRNIAVQGELLGPGVQNNREGFKEHRLYVFDIWDIDQRRYLTSDERHQLFYGLDGILDTAMGIADGHVPMEHVPLVEPLDVKVFQTFPTLADFLGYADTIKSVNHDIAEGVVFKSVEPMGPTFKVISKRFLLKEKD